MHCSVYPAPAHIKIGVNQLVSSHFAPQHCPKTTNHTPHTRSDHSMSDELDPEIVFTELEDTDDFTPEYRAALAEFKYAITPRTAPQLLTVVSSRLAPLPLEFKCALFASRRTPSLQSSAAGKASRPRSIESSTGTATLLLVLRPYVATGTTASSRSDKTQRPNSGTLSITAGCLSRSRCYGRQKRVEEQGLSRRYW